MSVRPWYATRQQVMLRGDIQYTAQAVSRVDDALASHSRMIEKKCQRPGGLFPSLRTIYFDWPEVSQPTTYRLWLGPDEAISLVSLTSAGNVIAGSLLEPNGVGPPYRQLQLLRSSNAFFGGGNTPQRVIAMAAWWGWSDDQASAGILTAAISSTSATTCAVSNSAAVGVGNQLIIDSERLVVTDQAMATTSQTITGNIAADKTVTAVPVSSGAAFAPGETILIDAERMLIIDISTNNLIVKRAYDGTVLAAHTSSTTVLAPRLLTVARGCQGSTAATHLNGAAVSRWVSPPEVQSLVIGESLNTMQQEQSAYARQIGSGETTRELGARGLKDLRSQVYGTELRRKARAWAV